MNSRKLWQWIGVFAISLTTAGVLADDEPAADSPPAAEPAAADASPEKSSAEEKPAEEPEGSAAGDKADAAHDDANGTKQAHDGDQTPPADDDHKSKDSDEEHHPKDADSKDAGHGADHSADHGGTDGDHGDDHGDHGHHDPADLGHGNASQWMERPEEWRYDLALCTLAVFLVLLAILTKFAWGPIMAGLTKRENSINQMVEEAERSRREAAAQFEEYKAKLAAAAEEAQGIINQARQDAEGVAEKIRADAQADATRQRDKAIADINAAKNAALQEVAQRGADTAIALAGRIVGRELKTDDHAALIADALDKLPSQN